MTHRNDPDGTRLPIKVDSTSNGEFAPIPLSRTNELANHLAMDRAARHAERRGVNRRRFLISSCGAASGGHATSGGCFQEISSAHDRFRAPGCSTPTLPASLATPSTA